MELPVHQDYRSLLLNRTPIMDLRAPIEFINGAFPCAQNVPLLNDDEREQVGTCYKKKGHHAAIELGRNLISGSVKQARIDAWKNYLEQHPDAILYCFRGGMRSRVSQQWIFEVLGIAVPRVAGGYKALRRFLIEETERLAQCNFIRLGGRTGVGKTLLLEHIKASIDLEGLANHKGSAFGKNITPQPTQINFENTLAIELLQHEQDGHSSLLVEDEGRNVGYVHLPKVLSEQMQLAPIVVLEQEIERRIEITLSSYIDGKLEAFQAQWGEQAGFEKFREDGIESLNKIKRRLGPDRHQKCTELLSAAYDVFKKTASTTGFEPVIHILLTEYYDPMYDYQLKNKAEHVVFTGNETAVMSYCQAQLVL